MYGGNFTRLKMSDLTSAGATIDINTDTQPYAYCSEDHNSTTKDIIAAPTKVKYYVLNTYNETVGNALNCTDTDALTSVGHDIYLKLPIPIAALAGSYSSTINLGMYSTQ